MPGAAQPCRAMRAKQLCRWRGRPTVAGRAACGEFSCSPVALLSPPSHPRGCVASSQKRVPRGGVRASVVPWKEMEADEPPASVCPTSAGAQSPPPAESRRVKRGGGGCSHQDV